MSNQLQLIEPHPYQIKQLVHRLANKPSFQHVMSFEHPVRQDAEIRRLVHRLTPPQPSVSQQMIKHLTQGQPFDPSRKKHVDITPMLAAEFEKLLMTPLTFQQTPVVSFFIVSAYALALSGKIRTHSDLHAYSNRLIHAARHQPNSLLLYINQTYEL